VITDLAEVHTAVEKLLDQPAFCFDVETRETEQAKLLEAPNARTNELMWIGLGAAGHVYLIPTGHPKGWTISREHKEKTPAVVLYGLDDPRSRTPTGKISHRLIEHTVPAVYGPTPTQLYPAEVMAALEPLMFSDRGKIGHNVKFDLQTVAKYYGGRIPPGPYHDTIILRHVLNEDEINYRLKPLVWSWLKLTPQQYPELGKAGVENFGMDDAARYLAKDVRYCWLMWKDYHARLKRKGVKQVYDFEMGFYPVLMDMEQAGFPVDRGNLVKVRTELETRIAELEQLVYKAAGGEFPMSNTNARRWIMFGEGKPAYPSDPQTGALLSKVALKSQRLRVLSRTEKTSTAQITAAVLEFHADRGNAMAGWLQEWSGYDKLRGTFIEGLDPLLTPSRNGGLPTIHTSFNQHGTKTGRLSSSKPNLQNLPRGTIIRDLFVADKGHVLVVLDYDQIELRALAHEAKEQAMIKIFMEGRDIHREAAAAAMRLQAALITPDQRQVGKTLNFATSYGAGPGKIAAVARTTMQEGQRFLDRYYEQFPRLKPWKSYVLREARARGDRANVAQPPSVVIPPFGRLRRLPNLFEVRDEYEWRRWHAERQAINAVIQGFASYITKLAMIGLAEVLPEYDAQMVVQVHDEIVIRTPERWVDEVLPLATSTMSGIRGTDGQPILGSIPLVVSAGTGYTWAEAKGK
jgi:DNA polymerase I-like protein with 3'-5' exonuclease and polymerase domains